MNAKVGKTAARLNLYVVDGNLDTLRGREWITKFVNEIDFANLFSTNNHINNIATAPPEMNHSQQQKLQQVLKQFDSILSSKPGKLVGPPSSESTFKT